MPKLVLQDGPADAKVYDLIAGPTTLGRTQDNGIWILHPELPPALVKGKSAALTLYRVRWQELPALQLTPDFRYD